MGKKEGEKDEDGKEQRTQERKNEAEKVKEDKKTRLVPSEIVSTHSKASGSKRADEEKRRTCTASKIFANLIFALTFTVISRLDRTRQSTEKGRGGKEKTASRRRNKGEHQKKRQRQRHTRAVIVDVQIKLRLHVLVCWFLRHYSSVGKVFGSDELKAVLKGCYCCGDGNDQPDFKVTVTLQQQ